MNQLYVELHFKNRNGPDAGTHFTIPFNFDPEASDLDFFDRVKKCFRKAFGEDIGEIVLFGDEGDGPDENKM